MYIIKIHPSGQEIEVEGTKDLLKELKEKGFPIKSSCGGVAQCSDCMIKIISGEENLTTPTFAEKKMIGNVFHITRERLSCQTYLQGNITIDLSHHLEQDQKDLEKKRKRNHKIIKKEPPKEKEILKEDTEWMKHWEKDDKVKDRRFRKLGGQKRPRYFHQKDED